MESSITAMDVAAYLVRQCSDEGHPLTQLQLQKLLVLCQSLYAHSHGGRPLFDDHTEAWDKGPVVRNVYNSYRKYGQRPITVPEGGLKPLPHDVLETIAEVITRTSRMSAHDLIRLTHDNGPWLRHYRPHGSEGISVPELAEAWSEYESGFPVHEEEDVDTTPATWNPSEEELRPFRDMARRARTVRFEFAR